MIPPLPPSVEVVENFDNEDDEEKRDNLADLPRKAAIAAEIRDLSDSELLALCGIDPHTHRACGH